MGQRIHRTSPTQDRHVDDQGSSARSSCPVRASAPSWSSASPDAGNCDGMDYRRRAGRTALHDAAGRDHLRFLRLAEVAHPRLRQPGLREASEQEADLVKVDILVQGEPVDAFSAIVHKDSAIAYGNKMTTKLKELIPRQQFEVPVQAAIGSKIIARENIRRSAKTS